MAKLGALCKTVPRGYVTHLLSVGFYLTRRERHGKIMFCDSSSFGSVFT